jgi:5-methyltetrahydrofolate--homocysteine methyltransferase
MNKKRISEVLASGRILVSDGAWGTFLHKKGLMPGDCPESWCLDRPASVLDIAKSYVRAGADMIETNSFGGSSVKLSHYGLAEKAGEINLASAKISREAAGNEKWVIASIGPTGKMLVMGDITEDELYRSFKEQAMAFEKGGADAICIETMSDLGEAGLAIRAAKENTNLEIIATFTFDRTVSGDYRTMMGVSPREAALMSLEAGADIIGTNCGNGFERMIDIVKQIKAVAKDALILVHANAGLPVNIDGADVFPETPEQMAALVPELVNAGANIIGGCCGTTPDHIRAIRNAVDKINQERKK